MSDDRVTVFNRGVTALISRLERKSRSDTEVGILDRLKRRLSLLKSTLGQEEPLRIATPIFTEFADRILEDDVAKRDSFFLTLDVRAEYVRRKGPVTSDDEPIFALIDSVKTHYKAANVAERNAAVNEVIVLLNCCLKVAHDAA